MALLHDMLKSQSMLCFDPTGRLYYERQIHN